MHTSVTCGYFILRQSSCKWKGSRFVPSSLTVQSFFSLIMNCFILNNTRQFSLSSNRQQPLDLYVEGWKNWVGFHIPNVLISVQDNTLLQIWEKGFDHHPTGVWPGKWYIVVYNKFKVLWQRYVTCNTIKYMLFMVYLLYIFIHSYELLYYRSVHLFTGRSSWLMYTKPLNVTLV